MSFLDRMENVVKTLVGNGISFEWKVLNDGGEVIVPKINDEPLTPWMFVTSYEPYDMENEYIKNDIKRTQIMCDKICCEIEEEKEMNQILKLYKERKEKEIHDKYEKLVEEEYNEIEFVKVYNNLVNTFEGALQELFEDETNVGCKYMTDTGLDRNLYKYRLASGRIQNEIREKYNKDIRDELDELHTLVNEVETMLSLANNNGNIDNVKVQEILIKYDIIDKDLKIQAWVNL